MTILESYIAFNKKREDERERIMTLLRQSGFMKMEPSYFESYDDYLKIQGRTEKSGTIKVVNPSGNVDILRPDITMNIMNEFSNLIEDQALKLCYDATVFDSNHQLLERRQIGAEWLNEESELIDIKLLSLVERVLSTQTYVLIIGHTDYLSELMRLAGLNDNEKKELVTLIYHKQATKALNLLRQYDVDDFLFEKFKMILAVKSYPLRSYGEGLNSSKIQESLKLLQDSIEQLRGPVQVDLSMVSEFEYYSGMIYTAYKENVNEAILKGGRYDQLSQIFSKSFPAVGFSLEFSMWMEDLEYENSLSKR